MLKLSHGCYIDGVWVGAFCDRKKFREIFKPVEEALHLIKLYDPLRYDRLRRDLRRVWVNLLPGDWGAYQHTLKMCVLDERFVLGDTTRPEQIASTIVHEATHARLMHSGIGYEAALRHRVEAVCFRRERAFAARLPAGGQAREEAEHRLTGYPADFWTDEVSRDRNDRGAVEAFRYLGMSEFFIRTGLRLRALLWRMHNLAQCLKRVFRSRRRP